MLTLPNIKLPIYSLMGQQTSTPQLNFCMIPEIRETGLDIVIKESTIIKCQWVRKDFTLMSKIEVSFAALF